MKVILLDLDGVVVNFVKSACRVHGRCYKQVLSTWTPGVWEMETVLGLTLMEFLVPINQEGAAYWANLELYPNAESLYEYCKKQGRTYFCTAPIRDSNCLSGKVQFLQKWLGECFNDFVITKHKHLLARPGTVLIDDSDSNVNKFRECGGDAILYPQIFNSNHALRDDQLGYVQSKLSI